MPLDEVATFNLIEAIWWLALGLLLLLRPIGPLRPRDRRAFASILLLFGLSDLIEIWSGAW